MRATFTKFDYKEFKDNFPYIVRVISRFIKDPNGLKLFEFYKSVYYDLCYTIDSLKSKLKNEIRFGGELVKNNPSLIITLCFKYEMSSGGKFNIICLLFEHNIPENYQINGICSLISHLIYKYDIKHSYHRDSVNLLFIIAKKVKLLESKDFNLVSNIVDNDYWFETDNWTPRLDFLGYVLFIIDNVIKEQQ